MGCVYIITNLKNRKIYIGKTIKTAEKRWAEHLSHARYGVRTPLHASIRKHGAAAFSVETLFESNDPAVLNADEIEMIAMLGARHPHGYNLTEGGDGFTSETARAQIMKTPKAERIAWAHRMNAMWTPEERSAMAKRRNAKIPKATLAAGFQNMHDSRTVREKWEAQRRAARGRRKTDLPDGVVPHLKRFRAKISVPGLGTTHLGVFDTPEAASAAYERVWEFVVRVEEARATSTL